MKAPPRPDWRPTAIIVAVAIIGALLGLVSWNIAAGFVGGSIVGTMAYTAGFRQGFRSGWLDGADEVATQFLEAFATSAERTLAAAPEDLPPEMERDRQMLRRAYHEVRDMLAKRP